MTGFLLLLFLGCALAFGLGVLYLAAVDGHRRGMARVHSRGRSWDARIPAQRQDNAA